MHLNELIQPKNTKAVFTFGRFNPPTKGHAHLLDLVKKSAGNGDHYVFTGRTNDSERNPLQYQDKITLMRAMFPTINIVDDPNVKNPWQALEELGKHYSDVTLVVGSDRKQDFQSQMKPYMKEFGLEKFQVISSGERDADASDVQGVSATKARAFARAGDFKSFAQTINGGEKLKQTVYNKVRQGMGITEATKPKMPKLPKKNPNPVAKQLADPKFRPKTIKDKKSEIDKGYVKHKGTEFKEGGDSVPRLLGKAEASLSHGLQMAQNVIKKDYGIAEVQAKVIAENWPPLIDNIKNVYKTNEDEASDRAQQSIWRKNNPIGNNFMNPDDYDSDAPGTHIIMNNPTELHFYKVPAKNYDEAFDLWLNDSATRPEDNQYYDSTKDYASDHQYWGRIAPEEEEPEESVSEAPKGKPIVYVDLDGVLANFFEEYAKLAKVKTGNYKDIPPAKVDPTLQKMVGTDFFDRLPKFPTTDKLLQMVTEMFGGYTILSAPLRGDHKNSEAHKRKWIQRELAIQPENIIVVGRKDSYATQQDGTPNVLIDDRGKNVQAWSNRGGLGIKYQADEDPISKVQDALTQIQNKNNLKEWGGLIVKGVNTTADVGMDAIKKQSAKLGFKVTKKGVPPIMNTKGQPKSKKLESINRMKNILIDINGSNKDLTLQQHIDLLEVTKGIRKIVEAKKVKRIRKANQAEVPYQNDPGTMSLFTHPGTELWQKMKATAKPGTDDWFKTWRTLSYLTKGRKNHYMLPIKEQLEKLLIKHGLLKESDVVDLQTSIQKRISSVTDPALLNKIASMLRRSNIGRITKMAFKQDDDAAKFINRLSEIIVGIEVPINDKISFLRKFGRSNFINPEVLFDNTGTVHSMDDWWLGTGFATTMFKLMIDDPELQGKKAGESGPGEVAIACFHKKISVGTDPKAGYDLKWGNNEIEVKTKASQRASSGGGRWTAYDGAPLETYLRSNDSVLDPAKVPVGVRATASSRSGTQPSLAQILNDPQYLKDTTKPLTQQEQKIIYAKVLKQAYQKAPDDIINSATANYPNITDKDVAQAAYASYKVKQGFQSMLLMKASGGGITTIHFSDLAQGIDNFKVNGPYVRGQKQRGMDVQATLR